MEEKTDLWLKLCVEATISPLKTKINRGLTLRLVQQMGALHSLEPPLLLLCKL